MKIIYRSSKKLKNAKLRYELWFDSGLIVDRLMRDYSLVKKTLSLTFMKGNCYKIADPDQGCSLFLKDQENLSSHSELKKADSKHCPYIYLLMQNETYRMFPKNKALSKKDPIYLCRHSCGHYSTGQGQHRLCISGTLRISLPRVHLGVSEKICEACENPLSANNLYTY